ncbi:thiol-disulfide oxidoreductase DCC family protein [Evansella sp. AB-rgal1]|uniref:thiol-disulfide oxidoreductase DCC family protein n=1 Tax=Evansella sp. AB-rgal1 TaxID=3242696 RepID=UPI00359CCC29
MKAVILFDGVCNFCVGSVQFIIKRDPNAHFQFASLQSDVGQKLLKDHGISLDMDSFILMEEGRAYSKSSAALRVCKNLKWNWRVLYCLLIVPRPIRDSVYSVIAKNRYKWFGKRDSCMLPTADVRKRFLEGGDLS